MLILFFHPQKLALIEWMNQQRHDLSKIYLACSNEYALVPALQTA